MNILLVSPHYPPRFIGGVELCTRRLAHKLVAGGHRTSVIAVERLGATDVDRLGVEGDDDGGVRVHRLSIGPRAQEERGDEGDAAFAATYRDPAVEMWLEGWLARERPDVVHLHSGYLLGGAVLRASARQGVPVVVTLHDFWFICPRITLLHPSQACCTGPETPAKCAWCLATEQRRYRLPERMLGAAVTRQVGRVLATRPFAPLNGLHARSQDIARRRALLFDALRGAAAIVSPSRFLRDEMGRAGFDVDRIGLLPYGIEPRNKVPVRAPDAVALRLGFLGQIAPHKGVHVLLQAMRLLPDQPIELVVHGDLTREPEYVRELQAIAAGDPRITFPGPLSHPQLDAFFSRIDMLAVPSVWYENSPFVIHEARFAGLPILASRLGGMAELVRDDHDGLLATGGDPQAFARQIARLVTEPGLLARLRAQVVAPPTIDDEVRALTAIYERISVGPPHTPPAPLAPCIGGQGGGRQEGNHPMGDPPAGERVVATRHRHDAAGARG